MTATAPRFRKVEGWASRYEVVRNGKVVGTVTGVGYDCPTAWVADKPNAPRMDGSPRVGYLTRAAAAASL